MSYSDSYEDSGYYDYGSILWDAACDYELNRLEEQADEISDRDDFQYEWDLIDAEREYAELEAMLDAEEHTMPSQAGGVGVWAAIKRDEQLGELSRLRWKETRRHKTHKSGVKGTTLRSHRPYQHGWYRRKGDDLGMHF